MKNPEYTKYIDGLLEKAMVKKMSSEDPDIDTESYEEVRSLSMELEDEIISPE